MMIFVLDEVGADDPDVHRPPIPWMILFGQCPMPSPPSTGIWAPVM
jgi:hypothetical protein